MPEADEQELRFMYDAFLACITGFIAQGTAMTDVFTFAKAQTEQLWADYCDDADEDPPKVMN
jgi:hypothetical protein